MHRTLVALAALVLWSVHASAEVPRRDHAITVDDYFTQADIAESVISPDGRYVAYTEARWQQSTDDRKNDLWVVETAQSKTLRLTAERASDRAPVWSPDARWVYFVGTRQRPGAAGPPYDGKPQVWRMSPRGGEPLAVTRAAEGIGAFELARDGQTLYYTTQYDDAGGDWQALRQRFPQVTYGYGVRHPNRVWKLNLENWRTEQILDEGRVIHEMALSPDGRRLALITTPDETVVSFEGRSRVDVCNLEDNSTAPVPQQAYRGDMPSPYGWLEKLAWSGDGRKLAFNVIFDGYPAEIMVTEWNGGGPSTFKLQRPSGLSLRGYGSPVQWRGKTDLCFLGEEQARVRLYCATEVAGGGHAAVETLTPGDVVVSGFSLTTAGDRAAVLMGDPAHLADLYLVQAAQTKQLTHVNPQADAWKMPSMSVVTWKGSHGDPVEGILELPPGHTPGRTLPLVVEIHGGPTTAAYFGVQFWIYGRTLLPAKGYALLTPNYRGSTGYGDKFLTELVGHENDIEVEDILKGVDALVERGIADPQRLAVCGWSNGGYLTNCIISQTTRFKAASGGAGIVDAVMEWGADDEPAYPVAFTTGVPWERPDHYRRASPTYSLGQIRTPTLIHVGGSDDRCPPAQSRMLYRALREYLHVPTELIIYPGEPHGLMKYQHRRAKMEWDLAWFERYVRSVSSR